MTHKRPYTALAFACALVASSSCDLTEHAAPQEIPLDPVHVTGAAARALGPDGRFRLGSAESLNGDRMINADQARKLSLAFVRTFGRFFEPTWEQDRGEAIDLATLEASERVYFAQSPYGSLSRSDVHAAYRRNHGPYFVVTLLSHGTPVVIMGVSALATDYAVSETGQLVVSQSNGMAFLHEGIPLNGTEYRPMSPEEAVHYAATMTGVRVVSVPELVITSAKDSPTIARWKVDLESDVSVQTPDGRARSTRTILVGSQRAARLSIPRTDEPRIRALEAVVSAARRPIRAQLQVPIHAGRTASFDIVHVRPQGR